MGSVVRGNGSVSLMNKFVQLFIFGNCFVEPLQHNSAPPTQCLNGDNIRGNIFAQTYYLNITYVSIECEANE